MLRSRWERIYDFVCDKFNIKEELKKEIEFEKGLKGKEETVIFQSSDKGKMKLVRLIKPKVEEIKYHYARRTSRGAHQTIRYSPTETIEIIKMYRLDQRTGRWEEVELTDL